MYSRPGAEVLTGEQKEDILPIPFDCQKKGEDKRIDLRKSDGRKRKLFRRIIRSRTGEAEETAPGPITFN